jgi:hypothetical protein
MNVDPRDLFDRARAGDQNAMKELVAIREGASRGDPSCRHAYDALLAFGQSNPMQAHGDKPGFWQQNLTTLGNIGGLFYLGDLAAKSVKTVVSKVVNISGEERHALGILRAADRNDPRAVMAALHHIQHPEAVRGACVALALQQPWTNPRIACFEGLLNDEPRRITFRETVKAAPDLKRIAIIRQHIPRDRAVIGSMCAGYCLGTARKFQLARLPNSPVSIMGADIGWECGEDYDTNEEIQQLAHSMGVRG